ncbi:hypothetical protein TWF102_001354 [Orbilia oligospora]|uniref:Uncharacterized protein n=1 Tax=Orbilia oligospora TaxID=2813651 RepID=A0A7C8NIA5_ORBOL|nr:hypothetical protein TWF102_001354 [Orbilia oligospora]
MSTVSHKVLEDTSKIIVIFTFHTKEIRSRIPELILARDKAKQLLEDFGTEVFKLSEMSPSVEREIQGVVARAVDEKLRPLILETRKQLPPRVIPSSILDNTRGGEKIKGLFQQLYIGESFRF